MKKLNMKEKGQLKVVLFLSYICYTNRHNTYFVGLSFLLLMYISIFILGIDL